MAPDSIQRVFAPLAFCAFCAGASACSDELTIVCYPNSDASRPLRDEPDPIAPAAPVDGGLLDAAIMVPSARDAATAPPMSVTSCPPEDKRRVQVVTGDITSNATWRCDASYLLGGYVTVKGGATLTIGPGTVIRGDGTSALLVTREGRLLAEGEPTQPVVFTSVGTPGMRQPGGWQGLILLGKASLNVGTMDRELEGLATSNPDFRYGGSDDTHDCGKLRYVRIEFAGHELQPNKEVNSLTVAACGSRTVLDYVQTHKGKDDGIEFFGGTASAKHLVVTGADDDSIDWDEGYRGKMQFVAIQQHELSGAGDSNGIEGSNRPGAFDAMPLSNPRIYNVTMVGAREAYNQVRGIYLKEGTHGEVRSVLALGFATMAIDVASAESARALTSNAAKLGVSHSIFHQIGANGTTWFAAADMAEASADGNFSEEMFFMQPMLANRFGIDPRLPAPFDLTKPGWVPPLDSPAASGSSPLPDDPFFDLTANFVGAFRPGGQDWTAGWTAYPAN